MSMDKPNKPYPNTSTSTQPYMPQQILDPSIRGASWDQLLQNRGIRFIHRKAIPCSNVTSLDSNSHEPDCPFCDNSGIIYYQDKEVFGVFQSSSLERTFEQQGMWEIGSAVCTLPTEYEDGTQADFNTYDKLVIPDFEIRYFEMKEYEPRVDNKQILRYPVIKVDTLQTVDRTNGVTTYHVGVDFVLTTDGAIQWLPGKAPSYDNVNERGDVFSISYYTNPVYNVLQPLRELRISQEMVNGQKVSKRLPQQILVKRDFFLNVSETVKEVPGTGNPPTVVG